MRNAVSCIAVVLCVCGISACQRPDASDGATPPVVKIAPLEGGGVQKSGTKEAPPAKGGVARRMQVAEVQNFMRGLGTAYINFELQNMRGPRNLDELAPFFDRNPKMMEALKNGTWVFIYNVNRQQLQGGAILAYEAHPDLQGNRVVVLGDGSVHLLNEAEFQKTRKAK